MWKLITLNDFRKCLSEPELTKLNTLAKDNLQEQIILDTIQMVCEAWRGAIARKHVVDTRAYYIPSEYEIYILAHVRYEAWTRMPQSGEAGLGLDDRRVQAYDRAMKVFDSVDIPTSLPEEDNLPVNYNTPKIVMPAQRIFQSLENFETLVDE